MADLYPQHAIRVALPASYPVACDSCGAAGFLTDGTLPRGWTAEELPSCQWPFVYFVACPRCVRESGAPLDRASGVAS